MLRKNDLEVVADCIKEGMEGDSLLTRDQQIKRCFVFVFILGKREETCCLEAAVGEKRTLPYVHAQRGGHGS